MTDYLDEADECLGGYDFQLDDTERARQAIDRIWAEFWRSGYWPPAEEVKDGS